MSNRTKLLAAHKTDVLDLWCPVKRPDCLIPEIHLSGWGKIPFFSKIPAKSDPQNPVVFTRPKLGKELYGIFKKKDFDTHFTKDLPLDYNCLHDPHLERHFRINRRQYIQLVKNNYITPYKDNVVCTQAEFNYYRQYLRDLIAQEEKIRRKDEEDGINKQREIYHLEQLRKKENRAWEWVRRALKRDKMERMRKADGLVPPTFNASDGEEDEAKITEQHEHEKLKEEIEEKRMKLVQHNLQKTLERTLAREKRKIDILDHKSDKATALWGRMEKHELTHMKKMESLKDKYDENMERRIRENENKFQRIKQRDAEQLDARRNQKRMSQSKKYERRKEKGGLVDDPFSNETGVPLDAYKDDEAPMDESKDNGIPPDEDQSSNKNDVQME